MIFKPIYTSKILGCVLLFAVFMTVMSCKLDSDPVPVTPVAFVSLYQASPNAPDFKILVDDRQINNSPFDYSDYTGYLRFYTGQRNLRFAPYGADNVIIDTTVTFEDGQAYSVFVVDEYQDADIVILKDNADQPAAGKAKVRFLNLSPDTQVVDFVENGQKAPLFDDQSFKASSEFKEIDATEHDFEVRSGAGTTLLNLPDTQLQPGWFYTIVVRGYSTPPAGNNNVLSAQVLVN